MISDVDQRWHSYPYRNTLTIAGVLRRQRARFYVQAFTVHNGRTARQLLGEAPSPGQPRPWLPEGADGVEAFDTHDQACAAANNAEPTEGRVQIVPDYERAPNQTKELT